MVKKNGTIPHIRITPVANAKDGEEGVDDLDKKYAVDGRPRTRPTTAGAGLNSPYKAPKDPPPPSTPDGVTDAYGTTHLDRALTADIEHNVGKFRGAGPEVGCGTLIDGSDSTIRSGDEPGPDGIALSTTALSPTATGPAAKILSERERKIGHRRVDEEGMVTYKRVTSSQLLSSIQLGLNHAIGGLSSKPQRDVLMQDFTMIEVVTFPRDGSSTTAAHDFSDFRFKTYAPIAFRYFRELFGIKTDDFLVSLCGQPPRELSNPGASGSVFFVTCDDEFILKTLQRKEASFLEKLLPGYYMNLNQNPRTLLPKFFGLYCYQSGGKNIRLIVMNNLIPSTIKIHEKYDLKGSTYKRKAGKYERLKATPTYKDLDFLDKHPDGLMLEPDTYDALIKTLKRDCLVLESFKIMDYSFLMGIHNLDLVLREKQLQMKEKMARTLSEQQQQPSTSSLHLDEDKMKESSDSSVKDGADPPEDRVGNANESRDKRPLNRNRSIKRVTAYSTAMESIQAESEPIDLEEQDAPPGGIPARNAQGERLLCFIGIIDILQCYELKKKLEHTIKSIFHDGDTVSVHRPSFYAQRFKDFICNRVFRKVPSPTLRPHQSQQPSTSTRLMDPESHFPFYSHKMLPPATPIAIQAAASSSTPLEPLPEEDRSGADDDDEEGGPGERQLPTTKQISGIAQTGAVVKKILDDRDGKPNKTTTLRTQPKAGGDFKNSQDSVNTPPKPFSQAPSTGSRGSNQRDNFFTSTPAKYNNPLALTTPDKHVPMSTYRFPPVSWKVRQLPSDLKLIDEYGNLYDPDIEEDIGRELAAKAQLESCHTLARLPSTTAATTPPLSTHHPRSTGGRHYSGPGSAVGISKASHRPNNSLSRQQFFEAATRSPIATSSAMTTPSGSDAPRKTSSDLRGGRPSPLPVTIKYRSLDYGDARDVYEDHLEVDSHTAFTHPPSPPRDYDQSSLSSGGEEDGSRLSRDRGSRGVGSNRQSLARLSRSSIDPRSAVPTRPSIDLNMQALKSRLEARRSNSNYGSTTSPVHPASHSTTPITLPSQRFGQPTNRSSLSNLMGPAPIASGRQSPVVGYQDRKTLAAFYAAPRRLVSPSFDKIFDPNHEYYSPPHARTMKLRNDRGVDSRQHRPYFGGESDGYGGDAATYPTPDIHVGSKNGPTSIRTSDSRSSMMSALSTASVTLNNGNNYNNNNNNISGTNMNSTTDYTTALEDNTSSSLSTPENNDLPPLFSTAKNWSDSRDSSTPDTVILLTNKNSKASIGVGAGRDDVDKFGDNNDHGYSNINNNLIFRDYRFKEPVRLNNNNNSSNNNDTLISTSFSKFSKMGINSSNFGGKTSSPTKHDNDRPFSNRPPASYQLLEETDILP